MRVRDQPEFIAQFKRDGRAHQGCLHGEIEQASRRFL